MAKEKKSSPLWMKILAVLLAAACVVMACLCIRAIVGQQNLERFFGKGRDRWPYTVDEVLAQVSELDGRTLTLTGYVSSVADNQMGRSFYLVGSSEDVLGYQIGENDSELLQQEEERLYSLGAIQCFLWHPEAEMELTEAEKELYRAVEMKNIRPSDHVRIRASIGFSDGGSIVFPIDLHLVMLYHEESFEVIP